MDFSNLFESFKMSYPCKIRQIRRLYLDDLMAALRLAILF